VGNGTGSQIVGGFVVIALGVITIAGIYQLGQQTGNNGIPAVAENVGDTTLNSIFK
jgi:hypothetical protein